MKHLKFLFFFLSLVLQANDVNTSISHINDTNITNEDVNGSEDNYIDAFHKRASSYVQHLSGYADATLINMADYLENNETNTSRNDKSITSDNKEAVDFFFLQEKYLDETDNSYIAIRPLIRFSSKEKEEYNFKISAHLALSKSKKRFKFFLNDVDKDNADNILSEDPIQSTPSFGLNYFAPKTYGIASKYSLGLSGIYPFARARYSKEFHPGSWIIEPVQKFKYSSKDEFEEETQIYFDKKLTELSLFRILFIRRTKSGEKGMPYDGSVSLFYAPSKGLGLSVSQYFNASTRYDYTQDINATLSKAHQFSGIINYGTSVTLRQNILRPWFFYEIRPGVNFHKQYDYKPNYTVEFFLDIFVGNF
ncbi:hypothetical protein JHD50_10490 [Sulfurimonas sp. MAG313]|nr:hypothetical protein [Sulfurimonas sp. MAG313]MDF1881721.1 hypothetical protein [Sulfurimonas sp. MAG313]